MKLNDILGLGKVLPIDKLIDVISSVTGRLSKPYFDRKDIDTKAYEIQKLAEAKAEEMKIIASAIKENYILLAESNTARILLRFRLLRNYHNQQTLKN